MIEFTFSFRLFFIYPLQTTTIRRGGERERKINPKKSLFDAYLNRSMNDLSFKLVTQSSTLVIFSSPSSVKPILSVGADEFFFFFSMKIFHFEFHFIAFWSFSSMHTDLWYLTHGSYDRILSAVGPSSRWMSRWAGDFAACLPGVIELKNSWTFK